MMSAAVISFQLQTPKQEQNISEEINEMGDNLFTFLGLDDIYELAKNASLGEIQSKLKSFLSGEIFEKFKEKWDANPGIEYVDSGIDAEEFPKGKICIQIKKDKSNMPLGLCIKYNPNSKLAGRGGSFNVNCSGQNIDDDLKKIRENDLTYLKKSSQKELDEEVDAALRSLETAGNEDRIKIISQFNQKWKDKLEMELTLDVDSGKGDLKVKDKFGFLSLTRTNNRFRIERTLGIESASPQLTSTPTYKLIQEASTNSEDNRNTLVAKSRENSFTKNHGYTRNNLFYFAITGATAIALGTYIYNKIYKP